MSRSKPVKHRPKRKHDIIREVRQQVQEQKRLARKSFMRVWRFEPYEYTRYGRIHPKSHFWIHNLLVQALQQGKSESRADRKNAEKLQDLLEEEPCRTQIITHVRNPQADELGEPVLIPEERNYLNPEGCILYLEDALHELALKVWKAHEPSVLLGFSRQVNRTFEFLEAVPEYDANKFEWDEAKWEAVLKVEEVSEEQVAELEKPTSDKLLEKPVAEEPKASA